MLRIINFSPEELRISSDFAKDDLLGNIVWKLVIYL